MCLYVQDKSCLIVSICNGLNTVFPISVIIIPSQYTLAANVMFPSWSPQNTGTHMCVLLLFSAVFEEVHCVHLNKT